MNMVCPDEGKALILDELFRVTGARESFVIDLFQNNVLVNDLSTAADFTIANFTGYAQWAVARADFNAAVIVANVGEIQLNVPPEFTCTGGLAQTIYGWIMRGASSGIIYFGQNCDTPRVMQAGVTEKLDPFKIKVKTFT